LEVDYFGAIIEGLVGSYFSPRKTVATEGGSSVAYHSVAVGFRDAVLYNLCDSNQPLPPDADTEYLVVAPGMAGLVVPTHEDSPKLVNEWDEGSCLEGMGFHWLKNTIPGVKPLSYKSNTVVPVVATYHPDSKRIAGIFFWAPQRMQNWDDNICNAAFATQDMSIMSSCLGSNKNFWDPGPGNLQMNQGPLLMCSNTCDRECYFEDSVDGTISTMHFFFNKASDLKCPPGTPDHPTKYCRNGFNFSSWKNAGSKEGSDQASMEISEVPPLSNDPSNPVSMVSEVPPPPSNETSDPVSEPNPNLIRT